ncbi:MAG: bifunctional oligoribonuclease/PAP phosphatase NrnA [Candidatus Falkowbacteria bacterium]
MNYAVSYHQAYLKIKNSRRLLVISHLNPDGDALSSVCAFLELANLLNLEVEAYCHGKKGDTFNYLPHEEKIFFDKTKLAPLTAYDVVLVLDCGSLSRTNLAQEILAVSRSFDRPYIIEMDHHPKMDNFADLEIRQPDKAATVEIIYNFLRENKVNFNKNLANCVLTGLLTDTGNFLYANSSHLNIAIASEMLNLGAQFPKIINSTLRNQNLLTMKLWGLTMDNLRINYRYNLAYSVITKEEIDNLIKLGSAEEIEGYLNYDVYGDIAGFLSNLSEVQAIMLLREEELGKIRGSLRTARPGVDISGLAKQLGGGGHPKASGFSLTGHIVKADDGWKIV